MTTIFRIFIAGCFGILFLSGSLAAQDSFDWRTAPAAQEKQKVAEGWFWTRPLAIPVLGKLLTKIYDQLPSYEKLEESARKTFRNMWRREPSPEELRYANSSAIIDRVGSTITDWGTRISKQLEGGAEKGNYVPFHEHFFADDGSFNTGYRGKEPAIFEEPKVGYTARTKGPFEVYIMKAAKERLAKPPTVWTAEKYVLYNHNCQDFTDALIEEYKKIKEELQIVHDTTTEYATLRHKAASAGGKNLANLITQVNNIDISKCSGEFRKSFGEYRTAWINGLKALQTRDMNKFIQANREKRAKAEALQNTCNKFCKKYNLSLKELFSELFLRYIREDCE
ncbi:MAG: C97 family peptidase [Planctomycetaceae bacterium]|jgi:hypothetical protein|nr:C97 family peptidase [Planctomycetaceae bacterium]